MRLLIPLLSHLIPLLGLGLLVGAAVWWISRGKERGGWAVALMLGVLGSLIATFLGPILGFYSEGERASLIASALGALALVLANSVRTRPALR